MKGDRQEVLELVASCWRAGVFDSRVLPMVATVLVAEGMDSPLIVDLAGLDLGPFDPRDAGDLFVAALDELRVPVPDLSAALQPSTVAVAWAVRVGAITERHAASWGYRLFQAADYPDEPTALVELAWLDDDYDLQEYGCSPRSVEEIDQDVHTITGTVLAKHGVGQVQDSVEVRLLNLITSNVAS